MQFLALLSCQQPSSSKKLGYSLAAVNNTQKCAAPRRKRRPRLQSCVLCCALTATGLLALVHLRPTSDAERNRLRRPCVLAGETEVHVVFSTDCSPYQHWQSINVCTGAAVGRRGRWRASRAAAPRKRAKSRRSGSRSTRRARFAPTAPAGALAAAPTSTQQAVGSVSLAHDGPPAALRGLVPRHSSIDRPGPDAAAADHRGARGRPAAVAAQGRTRGRRRHPARPRPQLGRDRGARRAWRRGRPRVRARRRLGRRGQAHRGQVVAQLRPRSSLRRRPLFSHDGPGSGAVLRRRAALRDPRARRGAAREGMAAGRARRAFSVSVLVGGDVCL